ncbi:DUF4304 domain-containing protein [Candidatus Poribacteria bacterium]|nr:DUF4304 domain-containing protein [Candidatus Poribacteria bacterium]
MAANTKDLERSITKLLKGDGFKKKGTSWYLENLECISVLDLQKSQWGGQYYINLGAFVKQLDAVPFPKEHQCHLRGRLSEIVADKAQLERYLDLEDNSSPVEQKIRAITETIQKDALPLLSSFQSLDGIKELLERGQLRNFLVSLKVKKLLGLEPVRGKSS